MMLEWYKVSPNNLDVLKEEQGVYLISVLLKNGKYAVVYAGQADNLNRRIKQHFSSTETNNELKQYLRKDYTFKISYAKVGKQYLDGVEKYLIFYYSPRFNNQEGNGNIQYRCNLPNVIKFPL